MTSPICRGRYLVGSTCPEGPASRREGIQLPVDRIDTKIVGFNRTYPSAPITWMQRVRWFLTLTKAAGRYGVTAVEIGVGIINLSVISPMFEKEPECCAVCRD